MPRSSAAALFAALLQLQSAAGLRRRSSPVRVADVPIVNYGYRHLQVAPAGAEAGTYDWIVKFKDGLGDERLAEFCDSLCWFVGHPSRGGVPLATVRATEETLQKMIEAHPGLAEFVEPDSPVDVTAVEEHERTEELWGHEAINLGQARYTGKGTHIYVMDSGIRVTHSDFGGRAIPTLDSMRGHGVVEVCDPADLTCAKDDRGHGTHVAGTAGGTTFGIAKDAVLHAMRVCCGGGNVNGGLDWIAQFAETPAVMTMSLGWSTTPESSRVAVDAVVNSGVTVTVSAGNGGYDSCTWSFGFIASAIAVGSSDSTNTRSSFSNFGTCVAIFAPGSDIVSANGWYDEGSRAFSGTSMAAPHVAGAAAMLLEENPSLTPTLVRHELVERSTPGVLTGLLTGDPNLLLNVAPRRTAEQRMSA